MDKKNTVLGILFIAAGIGFMFWQARQMEEQRRRELLAEPAPAPEAAQSSSAPSAPLPGETPGSAIPPEAAADPLDLLMADAPAPADEVPRAPEETVVLENDFIEVEFTTRGGAIRTVAFKQTKRGGRDDYVFNRGGLLPALSMSLAGADGTPREYAPAYRIAARTEDSITFDLDLGAGMSLRRTYSVAREGGETDPYIIRHETVFENAGDAPKEIAPVFLNLGTALPISRGQRGLYLNVGRFDGEDASFTAITKLTGSKGFFGIGASAPKPRIELPGRVEWASVKNQFFASVLSSDSRVGGQVLVLPVESQAVEEGTAPPEQGITGSVGYPVGIVPAGGRQSLEFDFYVGPKEFIRLQRLGNEQDLVMQFGFFGFFSKLLLAFMHGIHTIVPSWGWSIVIMTILIKLLFWPLTAKASRSQKRMAKIQKPMAELKEKYKDNPQKMQQETLKLFKEHQVNPVAGCLPMLIQMPIFLGLFYMLRTASELRFAPFLWISDLSQPDTVAVIAGLPLNILPLIMGASMFVQMRMIPMSPTADPTQQKIFKFLPLVFLVFLYNFSSGLVLYWTVQNLLTILQTKITNSRPDEEPVPAATPAAARGKTKGTASRARPRKRKS